MSLRTSAVPFTYGAACTACFVAFLPQQGLRRDLINPCGIVCCDRSKAAWWSDLSARSFVSVHVLSHVVYMQIPFF
jgi:hypothetical protein